MISPSFHGFSLPPLMSWLEILTVELLCVHSLHQIHMEDSQEDPDPVSAPFQQMIYLCITQFSVSFAIFLTFCVEATDVLADLV
jgi:hypothetical protein